MMFILRDDMAQISALCLGGDPFARPTHQSTDHCQIPTPNPKPSIGRWSFVCGVPFWWGQPLSVCIIHLNYTATYLPTYPYMLIKWSSDDLQSGLEGLNDSLVNTGEGLSPCEPRNWQLWSSDRIYTPQQAYEWAFDGILFAFLAYFWCWWIEPLQLASLRMGLGGV